MKLTKKKLTWIYLIVIGICLIYSFMYYSVFVPTLNKSYELGYQFFFILVVIPALHFSVMGCITIQSGLTMTKVSKIIKSSLKFVAYLIIGIHCVFLILFFLKINFFFFRLISLNYILLVDTFSYIFGVCALLINMDKFIEEN